MSNHEKLEFEALETLREVLQHVAEELASWRRRALKAEAERASLGVDHDAVATRERIVELEGDNTELRQRLETARKHVGDLLGRLRFLEEQAAMEEQRR